MGGGRGDDYTSYISKVCQTDIKTDRQKQILMPHKYRHKIQVDSWPHDDTEAIIYLLEMESGKPGCL